MSDRFDMQWVDLSGGVRLRGRAGGSGPPIVLLHGHPRTHTTTWHRSPRWSSPPATPSSPRTCANTAGPACPRQPRITPRPRTGHAGDVLTLMNRLGYQRFALVGHDRGRYVAFRLAMVHPQIIAHLALRTASPSESFARVAQPAGWPYALRAGRSIVTHKGVVSWGSAGFG